MAQRDRRTDVMVSTPVASGPRGGRRIQEQSGSVFERTSGCVRLAQPGQEKLMPKEGIHPKYENIHVKCACGNVFETRSTKGHCGGNLLGVPPVLYRQAKAGGY